MTYAEAYARVSQHFTGITGGLNPDDRLLVAEAAVRRASQMLTDAREHWQATR